MYNLFQHNLEKVPTYGMAHCIFSLLPYTLYMGQLPPSEAILQQPNTLVEGHKQGNK